jgi:hypothetical protein
MSDSGGDQSLVTKQTLLYGKEHRAHMEDTGGQSWATDDRTRSAKIRHTEH